MDAVLNWVWQGGVVAIATAGMLHLLDRARASVRCVVCWAALLVIVALPLIPFASVAPRFATVASNSPMVVVPDSWWTSTTVIAAAWAMWAALYGVRLAGAMVVVLRAKARSRRFPTAVESSLSSWQRVRGAGRPAPLVVSDRVRAAAVLGCGTPVIAVAPALVRRLEADELDRVVIHEWAHVQRRDDLANVGQLLVRAIAGWHPAVWWLDRRLSIERELACDEIVVGVTGAAKSYASCLVKLASMMPGHADVLLAAGALSSAGLSRRIARLVTPKEFVSAPWSRTAAALVIAVLCVLAIGIARVRIVEAAVSATVAHVLQPVVQAVATRRDAITGPRLAEVRGSLKEGSAVKRRLPLPAAFEPPRIAAADTPPDSIADVGHITESRTHSTAEEHEPTADLEPVVPPPLLTSASPVPMASPPTVSEASRSVWSPAAEAGVAIGRGSTQAGVATADAFTRFAKKIAGSF